jgi:hypothetical protein
MHRYRLVDIGKGLGRPIDCYGQVWKRS